MVNDSKLLLNALRFFSFALALGSAGASIYLALKGSFRPVILNQSFASLGVLAVCAFLAVILFSLCFAGAARWERLRQYYDSVRSTAPPDLRVATFLIIFFLCISAFAAVALRFLQLNKVPIQDQRHFLVVAEQIARGRGAGALWWELYFGHFMEDNRNPFYLWLLAFSPTMLTGKVVSLIAGALLVVTSMLRASTLGRSFAIVLGAILAVNFELLHQSAMVSCETWLTLFVGVAWYQLAMKTNQTNNGCIVIGVLFGLAYLTKASALMLFALTLMAVLFQRHYPLRHRIVQVCVLALSFGFVASPLLVRNARIFKNPFHNFNSRFLFADSFDEGVAQGTEGFWNDLHRYRRSHTDEQIARRLVEGIAYECFVLARTLGPSPIQSERAIFGVALLLLTMMFGFGESPHDRWMRALLIIWIVSSILFFGWYQPIASGDRFMLPLLPAIAWHGTQGICRLLANFLSVKRFSVLVVIAVFCWLAGWTALSLLWTGYAEFFPS